MASDLSRLRIERKKTLAAGHARRPRRWWWLLAVALLVVLAAAYAMGAFRSARPVDIAVASVTYPSEGYTVINASGYVVAQRKAAVASKGTGRLEYLGVEEGSHVKAGQIIARLENDDLKARRREIVANLATARAALAQAEAELADAGRNHRRQKTLLAEGVVARAQYDTAQARYDIATAAQATARSQIRAAEAALAAAEVNIEYTNIRAPFDGVILTKNADVGEVVAPLGSSVNTRAAVVTMADMSSLDVEADVSESNLGKVRAGQPTEIQLDALPGVRLPGRVHMIVPTADRSKATVLTKIRFLEPDARVLPEMSAKVAFLSRPVGKEERPVLAVPREALVGRGGKTIAFVVKDGLAHETTVRTGRVLGNLTEVSVGLKAGDQVVLRPRGMADGAKVRPSRE
ncbi:MAG: efflux RND transporter periplasmic adaptor subunit [Pseudomonadota bacterium]